MYQALYRKYRPRRFCDVAGQEHITETLRSQIKSDRLTHAYLFVGTRGTGKTSCAKILSRAVNCLNPMDGNPCNECSSCTGIENGAILDVVELDAASNNGVDDVRAMREEAIYSPSFVKKRVYIIDEVHMLSTQAFNALLKILEEPPEHIIFILATTEMHKVLPTIQSRCQKFMFRRLTPGEIAKRLCEIASNEGMTLKPEAATKLSILADGSMRDGISLLDQCASDEIIDLEYIGRTLGLATQHELLYMTKSIANSDTIAILETLDGLYKDGKDMAALLNELTGILRDLLVVRLAPDSSLISSGISTDELRSVSSMFTPERLFYCLETAKNALFSLSRTGITRLATEMCLIRMINEHPVRSGRTVEPLPSPQASQLAELASPPMKLSVTQEPKHIHEPGSSPGPEDAGRITDSKFQIPDSPPHSEPHIPHSEKPAPAQTGNILSDISSVITDTPLLAMLSDSSKVRAEQVDDTLVFYTTNTFNADALRNLHIDTLKEAAQKVLEKPVKIRIETEQNRAGSSKQSKLDDLLAFDVVKVEQ